jgi:hypothetical protein
VSGEYTSSLNAGTNLTATVTGLSPGGTYYFATAAYDSMGDESAFSDEVSTTLPLPATITAQPLTQTANVGAPVTLAVSAAGTPPLSYQWMEWRAPIAGATASFLSWPQIGVGNAGNYTVVVSNPWGSTTSSPAVLTVSTLPSILVQPQSETVIATTAASFSSAETGPGPLSIQWYLGSTAIAGATSSSLAWAGVAASNAGNYHFTVANARGAVTSSVATLTVLPTNTIASAAGAYNGLFYQTNALGAPAVADDTAGFLGNCSLTRNGSYSARVYLGGFSYSMSGAFNIFGNSSATISRSSAGLSNLVAVLQVDLISGTQQITGTISSVTAGGAWTSPLVADLATNAFPELIGANLLMSSELSGVSPINFGQASGVVVNGVLSLAGVLGGTVALSQTVPISRVGNVPIYIVPYGQRCLLEGWINLAGGTVTGNLTWVCPSNVFMPIGFPPGTNAAVQVSGSTLNN